MAEKSDVVSLYACEAISVLEACGFEVVCISTAPKEQPIGQMRVIRQKIKSPGLMELVLSNHPIILKGGGNGGIQNY